VIIPDPESSALRDSLTGVRHRKVFRFWLIYISDSKKIERDVSEICNTLRVREDGWWCFDGDGARFRLAAEARRIGGFATLLSETERKGYENYVE